MDWLFEGLGTMIIGLMLGVAGDRLWINMGNKRTIRQSQKAGDGSVLTQVGRDMSIPPVQAPPEKPQSE